MVLDNGYCKEGCERRVYFLCPHFPTSQCLWDGCVFSTLPVLGPSFSLVLPGLSLAPAGPRKGLGERGYLASHFVMSTMKKGKRDKYLNHFQLLVAFFSSFIAGWLCLFRTSDVGEEDFLLHLKRDPGFINSHCVENLKSVLGISTTLQPSLLRDIQLYVSSSRH